MIKDFKNKQPRDFVAFDPQYKYWKARLECYNDIHDMLRQFVLKYTEK